MCVCACARVRVCIVCVVCVVCVCVCVSECVRCTSELSCEVVYMAHTHAHSFVLNDLFDLSVLRDEAAGVFDVRLRYTLSFLRFKDAYLSGLYIHVLMCRSLYVCVCVCI